MDSTADAAEQLLDTAAKAVWEADDFDYNDYERAIERPFQIGKPYLENDSRYRRMAAEAIAIALEMLAAADGESARAERYRQLTDEVKRRA